MSVTHVVTSTSPRSAPKSRLPDGGRRFSVRKVIANKYGLPQIEYGKWYRSSTHNGPLSTLGENNMSTLPWYLRARLKPRQLLLLVALADEGNIHRASEILRMAQPGASKLLKDLEDMLGVELFERHSRGMRPTWY